MSFWNLSDNTQVAADTSFEQEGGTIESIPNNTTCQAYIEEAKWTKGYQTEAEYINIRWRVVAPKAYNNRVIFQKLWVNGDNPDERKTPEQRIKQGDNAKRMLAAIDANTGGGLLKAGVMPDDQALQVNLLQKPMNIKVMKWEIKDQATGETKYGNWISAVSPRSAVAEPVKAAPVAQTTAEAIGDEIPF